MSTIASIETAIVDLPVARPHKLAMATIHAHSLVIVRLRTGEGVQGTGEVAVIPHYGSESPEAVKSVIDTCLAPHLIGCDVRRTGELLICMDRLIKGNGYAKAGVEMAALDAKARALGVPVSELFGGTVLSRLPVLWVLGNGDVERDIAEAETRLEARTHRLFLVKIGQGDPAENVARALAVKRALGDRASVRVDVNQGWDEATASWGIARLEAGGIDAVEQPVPAWNLPAMRRLAERFTVPVMADEAVTTVEDALAFAREAAADAFSIKLVKHGGLTRIRQVAGIAEAAGISLFGGTMIEGAIGTSAYAQLLSTLPRLAWGCQLFGPQLLTDDIAVGSVRYEEFELVVPAGPGFGFDIDEDKLAHYRRTS
ncbi:muconate cycloisomerase family protein [Xylophilus sp.]|uniref:muconate cycloisomerase family protein n=1 Tax=Xylophilus sp. TaxID=2653893 RepID=UPI0013BC1F66|nr:muconate cycloisomerase family protein [Xylophilus sp.]KAF1046741.1 MAG: Muconate cycloisomerase 1 [Xylophilus sp.]